MSIIQAVIASIASGSAPPPPPPPYYGTDFSFDPELGPQLGSNGWWTWGGSITAAMSFSSNPPSRDAYTYPDGSAEHVYTFNGTDNYMISPQLATTGSWPDGSITVDMWFYPTAYGVILLAELGQNVANNGYNYNMMEIDSNGNLWARVFPGEFVSSPNTVVLNAWNHVYFFHDVQNSLRLELNGNLDGTHAVNGSAPSGYSPAGQRYFSWGTGGLGTNMGKGLNYFQGKIGTVHIYDTIQSSTYNATKIKHAVPELIVNLDASNTASYTAQYTVTVNSVENSGTELHVPKVFSSTIGNQVRAGYPVTTSWGSYNATVTSVSSGTGGMGPEWIFTIDTNVAPGFAGGDTVTFTSIDWTNLVSGGGVASFHSAPAHSSTGVKYIDFAGNNWATMPTDVYFNQDFTIVSWVNIASYANWERIIDFGNGAGVNTVLLAASNGTSGDPALRSENAQFSTNTPIPLNTWTQVVARLKADGNASIFINGTNVMNYSGMTIPSNVTRSNCYIGKSNWPDALLNGKMGELQIYRGAVSDADITTNYNSTINKYYDLSLVFNQPQGDYLSTPASADWNLGTTGTIEFWLNANNASSANIHIPGGQWGLINQGGWYYGMPNNSSILIGLAGGKLSIAQSNTDDVQFTEPTAGIWTHVAVVYDSGTQKVFYNGVEQTKTSGNYLGNGWTNSTSDLYIGRLAPTYQSHFDGKMALVRISNTAKYSTTFTPTTTYGVEADTKLFLGTDTPLVDSMSHTITNNGVTLSTDVPGAFAPQSLQLVQAQTDYLDVAASSDWALSRTWTIEFWSKASKVSTENDLLTVMCQDYTDGNSIQIIYQAGSFEIQGTNRIAAEPPIGGVPSTLFNVNSQGGWNGGGAWTNLSTTGGTGSGLTVSVAGEGGGYVNAVAIVNPGSGYTSGDVITATGESSFSFTIGSCTPRGVWTHVALVNTVADGMTLYYNGVSQYTGGYWSLANNTAPIRIGARGLDDFQRFDGKLAMIRISNTAKYTGAFTPTITYGVEADTKLFLGGAVPLIDAKGHAVTNHGVTTNTDFPT